MPSQLAPAPWERARAELLADPSRANRDIAELAGVTRQTASRTRRQLEAAGLIPARASHRPPAWHAPELPSMPEELAWGSCVSHPHADWWTARAPSDRARAIAVCAKCPVRVICAEWSLSLPAKADSSIWGGMSHAQRLAARRERAQAVP